MNELFEHEFRAMVEQEWRNVPEKFRGRIDNVALLIEDTPSSQVREREGLHDDETLLGLYQGVPETERGSEYGVGGTLPDTITLYRLPLMEEAEALFHERGYTLFTDAVTEAIRETLWHEVGHYFGLHEEEVQVRERTGTNRFHHERN